MTKEIVIRVREGDIFYTVRMPGHYTIKTDDVDPTILYVLGDNLHILATFRTWIFARYATKKGETLD